MSKDERYSELLDKQIEQYRKETRCLEFKSNYQDAEKLGQYISALSNGACLDGEDFGYLYFGIEDGILDVKGTTFDPSDTCAKGNQALELWLRLQVNPRISFKIEEFQYHSGKRVVRIQIPAAKQEPTTFNWKAYIRVDSHVTSLERYTDWMRTIYNSEFDWSAQAIENATMDDLDHDAIMKAREGYKQRYPQFAEESDKWSDETFLDKACLTIDGMITRTTILLVGKQEKAHKLNHIAQIVWKCYQDGEIFGDIYGTPFILSTTNLLGRIRNYRFKIYPPDSLIPAEVWKYDTRSILEGMHNSIAHQDYTRNERIIVTETKDKLTFQNGGNFFVGEYEDYIEGNKTPSRYRNPALVKAMVNIKMIDTQGYGIHGLFARQKERFLPMPDYEGTTDSQVVLNMPGVVIDEKYSLLLLSNSDITLTEAYLLDQLQKGHTINDNAIEHLRRKHLVEGRKPNVYPSKPVALQTGEKIEYSQHKGLEEITCKQMLIEALKEHGTLTRKEIDKLLWNALSDQLNENQKKVKIRNLLWKWQKKGYLSNTRNGSDSIWTLLDEIRRDLDEI
ncbi:MAG: putative DNA binding domain-containing protein [Bacteroidales bacterium]|nr:putative DNA binding domain-containing protein [Bacteroidales bacterium]